MCNETLVHIVKQAEAQTGAGTATVTRALADDINENALPQDKVKPSSLQDKVRYNELDDKSIMGISHNKPKPTKDQSLQDKTLYGLKPKPKKRQPKEVKTKYVDESTEEANRLSIKSDYMIIIAVCFFDR